MSHMWRTYGYFESQGGLEDLTIEEFSEYELNEAPTALDAAILWASTQEPSSYGFDRFSEVWVLVAHEDGGDILRFHLRMVPWARQESEPVLVGTIEVEEEDGTPVAPPTTTMRISEAAKLPRQPDGTVDTAMLVGLRPALRQVVYEGDLPSALRAEQLSMVPELVTVVEDLQAELGSWERDESVISWLRSNLDALTTALTTDPVFGTHDGPHLSRELRALLDRSPEVIRVGDLVRAIEGNPEVTVGAFGVVVDTHTERPGEVMVFWTWPQTASWVPSVTVERRQATTHLNVSEEHRRLVGDVKQLRSRVDDDARLIRQAKAMVDEVLGTSHHGLVDGLALALHGAP